MAVALRTEPGIHLEIAGDGVLRSDLEQLAVKLGIASHVRFLGEITDIPAPFSRASLFVLPSRSEGISLTLLEAMARGLPVVATKVGGNNEVVLDGVTGLLVAAEDPAAMAAKICELVNDMDRCRMMGRAGRLRVEAHFDIRGMLSVYDAPLSG